MTRSRVAHNTRLQVAQLARLLTVDLLRFTPEEVFASYTPGECVLEHVRTSWNWQALEEASAQHIN